jgi:hypothetical protein
MHSAVKFQVMPKLLLFDFLLGSALEVTNGIMHLRVYHTLPTVPGALSPEVKRQMREAEHSPPTSAQFKKNVDLHIHSPIRLHVVVLS